MVKRLSTVDQDGTKIINVATPTLAGDATNKSYVDNLIASVDKTQVKWLADADFTDARYVVQPTDKVIFVTATTDGLNLIFPPTISMRHQEALVVYNPGPGSTNILNLRIFGDTDYTGGNYDYESLGEGSAMWVYADRPNYAGAGKLWTYGQKIKNWQNDLNGMSSNFISSMGGAVNGNLDFMSMNRITGLAPGIDPNDAATVSQLGGVSGGSSPTTTKGDLAGFSTVSDRVPVGVDGQMLMADSTTATGLTYAFTGQRAVDNYAPNPSFEVDLTGWTNYGGGFTATQSADFAMFGTKALKIVAASPVDGGVMNTPQFALPAGTYTFSIYMKASSDVVNAHAVIRGGGITAQINQAYPGNDNFNRYSVTFTTAGGNFEILLGLGSYGPGSQGTVYYDGLLVELGSSATEYFDGDTIDTATTAYSWRGTAGTSQSYKAVGASLTNTDYLPEGAVNQYFIAPRAVAAINGATINPTTVNASNLGGSNLRIYDPNPPASATSPGTQGEIRWDSNNIYVCVSSNTWKRIGIATW